MREATLIFHLKIKTPPTKTDIGYIFNYSDEDIFLTAFVKEDFIFFGIPKRNEIGFIEGADFINYIKIPANLDKPSIISFSYSCNNNEVKLIAHLGTEKVEEKLFNAPNHNMLSIFYHLGAGFHSDNSKNFGYFNLYETLTYSKILKEEEIVEMNKYFSEKEIIGYVDFNGNEFLSKDLATGNLVSPNQNHQPKYRTAQ